LRKFSTRVKALIKNVQAGKKSFIQGVKEIPMKKMNMTEQVNGASQRGMNTPIWLKYHPSKVLSTT
jgi:hypothetical protein